MSDDHLEMLEYRRSSGENTFWNSLSRSFTIANVGALAIWLGLVAFHRRIELMDWLRTLALTISITISGWWADRLWYDLVARKLAKPFGLIAYASRLPFYFVFSGLFFTIAVKLTGVDTTHSLVLIACIGGAAQCLFQIPYQWIVFNRLRKMVLSNL